MGRTALAALLSLAAASPGAAGSAASAEEAGARFERQVAEGRRTQAAIAPLLDELSAARRAYDWERDGARAKSRRDAVRGKLAPLIKDLARQQEEIAAELGRYSEAHGLEAIERIADSRRETPPEYLAAMSAHTFENNARNLVSGAEGEMRWEESAYAKFAAVSQERRRSDRLVTFLSLALGAAFIIALGALLALRGRRLRQARQRRSSGPDVIELP